MEEIIAFSTNDTGILGYWVSTCKGMMLEPLHSPLFCSLKFFVFPKPLKWIWKEVTSITYGSGTCKGNDISLATQRFWICFYFMSWSLLDLGHQAVGINCPFCPLRILVLTSATVRIMWASLYKWKSSPVRSGISVSNLSCPRSHLHIIHTSFCSPRFRNPGPDCIFIVKVIFLLS